MTREIVFSEIYRKRWVAHESSWKHLLVDDPVTRNWNRPQDMPWVGVDISLLNALQCMCAGTPDASAAGHVFAQRAVDLAENMQREKRLRDTPVAEAAYPFSSGVINRDRTYARWLLGEPLNRQSLRWASECISTWCLTKANDRNQFLLDMTQDIFLQSVRVALVAGNLPYATELLGVQRQFRHHYLIEKELWSKLVSHYPDVDDDFDAEYELFFDEVRDPGFSINDEDGMVIYRDREILAFEAGMIREMYVIQASPQNELTPADVIQAVAR